MREPRLHRLVIFMMGLLLVAAIAVATLRVQSISSTPDQESTNGHTHPSSESDEPPSATPSDLEEEHEY
jgi:hypothetical protein